MRVAISRLQDEADKTVADTGFADLFYGGWRTKRGFIPYDYELE